MSTKTQEIYLQAKSKIQQTTMASRKSPYMYSPSIGSMSQTYRKLASSWDAKTGNRDHLANVFCNTVKSDAVLHVPAIMMSLLNDLHASSDMLKELQCVNPGAVKMGDDTRTIWIYSMRPSDAMPKNAEELECLYSFVNIFAKKHFNAVAYDYVTQHIHIAVCFFVWFFTKQNFYYYTKEIRQTTRGGIQKQWRSVLLTRVPPVMVVAQNTTVPKARGDLHQKTILAKLEEGQAKLITDITKLITSGCVVDFDDASTLHKTISQCTTSGNKNFVGNKQGKKLQKTYDEYVKVTDKVKKTRKSVFQIEAAEKKMALTIAPPPDWGSLGEPPSPPKLIRQSADCLGALSPLPTTNIQTPEPVNSEDVPESWEDL
jgi:hypothetical protein